MTESPVPFVRKTPDQLRAEIAALVQEYSDVVHAPRPFVPGESAVPVSGKVIGARELQLMVEASLDGWLTTGRFNAMFEERLAKFLGVRHLITVNSGSSANLVAFSTLTSERLGARAIRPGDEVIGVAAGFPTTVNPILQFGAVPVFVDVDLATHNIDASKIEAAISPKTKAIMLAHSLGNPFNLDVVTALCRKHGLWLVEDCCDALGAKYDGRLVGTFGDIGTLSFYPAHHITMGEGGAVFTNNPELKLIAESFRDWGRDCWCAPGKDNTCGKRFCWKLGDLPEGYDHKYTYSHLGYNLKITDMQAACALAQMDRLDDFIAARKANFAYLKQRLARCAQFLHLPVPGRDGATAADRHQAWSDIVSRLEKGRAYVVAGQKLVTHPGKLYGRAGREQIAGGPDLLEGALTQAAKEQLADDAALLRRFAAARDTLLATLAETDATIKANVDAWPENFAMGPAAYDRMLKREMLLPYGTADLENMARDELAHGWAEEAWLKSLAATRKQSFGAETGGGMAPGGAALVPYYRDRIARLRAFVVDHDLLTIPDWLGTIAVVETPKYQQPVSPGASMESPRLFASSANGYYFITPPASLEAAAARLDMNEDFDSDRILQTAAHEAMPGHFLQLSIARRHSDYVRKIQDSAAFEEGWAFYGEEMFVRLGLYGDDLDPRLFAARWERVRGARVIVDVKMATGQWTVAQAAKFFEEQSGFTRSASEAAVAGYALRPGYVLAYTVGRRQLEELLGEYQHRMGDKGSLHDFHDRLLSYGSVPFAIVAPELLADLDKPASAVRAVANY